MSGAPIYPIGRILESFNQTNRSIIELICCGKDDDEVISSLNVSKRTVGKALTDMYKALGIAHTRCQRAKLVYHYWNWYIANVLPNQKKEVIVSCGTCKYVGTKTQCAARIVCGSYHEWE